MGHFDILQTSKMFNIFCENLLYHFSHSSQTLKFSTSCPHQRTQIKIQSEPFKKNQLSNRSQLEKPLNPLIFNLQSIIHSHRNSMQLHGNQKKHEDYDLHILIQLRHSIHTYSIINIVHHILIFSFSIIFYATQDIAPITE